MKTQLIVALDVDSKAKALKLVKELYPKVKIFKIGLQLFTKEGPGIVKAVQKTGAKVFLDLKFYDIPNTARNAVVEAAKLGAFMLTLHTSGGAEMLKSVAGSRGPKLNLLGVTVLTSKKYAGMNKDIGRLAKLAKDSGLQGVVCPVPAAKLVRQKIGRNLMIVCPGIRPSGFAKGDQKQVATATQAANAGVDYIVVGRPIIASPNPLSAAQNILAELG